VRLGIVSAPSEPGAARPHGAGDHCQQRSIRPRCPRSAPVGGGTSFTSVDFARRVHGATTDVWEIGPESASRVGHPAPFPVELPSRLIHLHTYVGDLVLDPFMGSGTTAVAAVRSGRHFAGYDTDLTDVRETKRRVDLERVRPKDTTNNESSPLAAGVTDIGHNVSFPARVDVDFVARDPNGGVWHFESRRRIHVEPAQYHPKRHLLESGRQGGGAEGRTPTSRSCC
jgi:hypothetical protein